MALLIRQLCLIIIALFAAPLARADESLQLHEQEIKAGLLYNFLKYTDWPAARLDVSSTIVVCIFGDDPFDGYLQPMAGRTVNQRTITLRTLHTPNEALACHLVFVTANEKARWPELLNVLKGKSIVTVSDLEDFTETGGMIEFTRKDNHIGVDLNMEAAHNAGLSVQDRLLRLVTVVPSASPEGGR